MSHDPARRGCSRARQQGRWHVIGAAAVLTVVVATGCGSPAFGPASVTVPQPSPSPAAVEPTRWSSEAPEAQPSWLAPWLRHTTPRWLCPGQTWVGLTVQAEDPREVTYLQSVPACTLGGARTWLRNNSDVVWTLHASARVSRPVAPIRGQSFRAIMSTGVTGMELVAPKEEVLVESAPALVSWSIDLPATLAWEAHDHTLDQIQSFGMGRVESALQRRGTEGAALTQCTLSGLQIGLTAGQLTDPHSSDLTDADTQELLIGVIGSGAQAEQCLAAAHRVRASTRVLTPWPDLGERLAVDLRSSSTLAKVHTNLSWAQQGYRVAGHFLRAAG